MNYGMKFLFPIALFMMHWLIEKTPSHKLLVPPTPMQMPRVLPLSSILNTLNSSLFLRYCCFSSHAPGPFIPRIMASLRLHSYPSSPWNSGLTLARSAFLLERTLLNVITGIDEGVLQAIPWESLPFCRSFVK